MIETNSLHFNSAENSEKANKPVSKMTDSLMECFKLDKEFAHKREWKQKFSAINSEELHLFLQNVFKELSEEVDQTQVVKRLSEILPQDKIKNPQFAIDALTEAKSMLGSAKEYLEKTENSMHISVKSRLVAIYDSIISIIETILNTFGLTDFFAPAQNDFQRDMKGQKVMMLLSLFVMVSTVLLPILGAATGGIAIGAILLTLIALSIIWRFIRPEPSHLPNAEAWTKSIKEGEMNVSEGRTETIQGVAETFESNMGLNNRIINHVMLIGDTGVGKTEDAKAVAKAFIEGKYPKLKGKKFFYFNTADLVKGSMFDENNRLLKKLKEEMGRHAQNFVLIFDEFHMAFKEKYEVFGNQLKTFLDPKSKNSPYMIAITTKDEYLELYLKHPQILRRFNKIIVKNTDENETTKILNTSILESAPETLKTDKISNYIFHQVTAKFGEEAPQPAKSLKILSDCIKLTSETQKTKTSEKLVEVRKKIKFLEIEGATEIFNEEMAKEMAELQKQLQELERTLRSEKTILKRLNDGKQMLTRAKAQFYKTILKMGNANPSKTQLNEFMLYRQYAIPALRTKLHGIGDQIHQKYGVHSIIDQTLVDQVIAEDLKSIAAAKEAAAVGSRI